MDTKTQSSFADGWKILYQARTVFAIFLLIAVVANLAIFFTARFGGVTKHANLPVIVRPVFGPGVTTPAATTTAPAGGLEGAMETYPATRPVGLVVETSPHLERAMRWYRVFENVMKLTAILALVSVVFLVFCALLGVMMLIAGQLPGVGALTGAFFWSVGIVVLMLPWGNLLPETMCLPIGLASFHDIQLGLRETARAGDSWMTNIVLILQTWVKFVVIPVLIILIDLMYLKRTAQAREAVKDVPSLMQN